MLRHFRLALDGTVQRLSDVLPTPVDGQPRVGGRDDGGLRGLSLQAGAGNSAAIYVGGDDTVSATVYGVRIRVPTQSVPDPPLQFDGYDAGPIKLSKIWVIGADGEFLHIFGLEY